MGITAEMQTEFFKHLLFKMFQASDLHHSLWDAETMTYAKSSEDCHIEVFGNEFEGLLASYFSYWFNDIASVAAHLGIGYYKGNLTKNIPPAPAPNWFWDEEAGLWVEPYNYVLDIETIGEINAAI